jgi:hypothetical protein
MYYNIYVNAKNFDIKETLDIGLETGWHDFLSFKTENEVLSYVRSELYEIYKWYDKDPHTKVWINEFGEACCLIRFIDVWGFTAVLIRVEKIKQRDY